jgi:3-deoxy-manno-octulosonate cytidylyltransferase (CMP-KDO synthetase)
MSYTVLIPARLASTRLPNKPLADIAGKPMVVRVAERALQSGAARVVVACDDARIAAACEAHSVAAVLTRADHASGSDRLAQASELLGLAQRDVVVNVQGDEPLIDPALIDAVAQTLLLRSDCAMSTAAHPITDEQEALNPNVVKVVLDAKHTALYFSRSPIAYDRDGLRRGIADQDPKHGYAQDYAQDYALLRHVGIYAYRVGFLQAFPKLAQAPIERLEALEQLRALWHGHRIAVHITASAPGAGVDTLQDLQRVRAIFAAHNG